MHDTTLNLEFDIDAAKAAEDHLRVQHPHGHPDFFDVTLRELKLHSEKNYDYARGGDPLGNFSRVSAILSNYPGLPVADGRVVALVYALKQLDAVLWAISKEYEPAIEGLNARLGDISIYCKLIQCMNLDSAKAKEN